MNRLPYTLRTGRSSLRPVALFIAAVLLQVQFLRTIGPAGDGEVFSVLIGLAAVVPIAALAIFLFPDRALIAVPLLTLVPIHLAGVFAFEFVFLGAVLASFAREAPTGLHRFRPSPMDVVFLLYVLWGFLAVTQAQVLTEAIYGMKALVLFLLAFVAGSRILGSSRSNALLRIVSLLPVGICLEILFLMAAEGYSLRHLEARLGTFTDIGWGRSNYVAAVAALASAPAMALALVGKGWERRLGFGGVLAATLVATLTISRGGAVALLAVIVVAVVLTARKNLMVSLAVPGAVALAYVLSPMGQANFARFTKPEELASIGARFLFFREALIIAKDHPLLGVGPDQIPHHTHLYMDPNPHNIFLKNAADLGFVGLGLFVLLLLMAARRWFRLRGGASDPQGRLRWLALALILAAALVNASYEPTLEGTHYGFLFWLLVGAMSSPGREKEEGGPQ